jgi:hypothetical protein
MYDAACPYAVISARRTLVLYLFSSSSTLLAKVIHFSILHYELAYSTARFIDVSLLNDKYLWINRWAINVILRRASAWTGIGELLSYRHLYIRPYLFQEFIMLVYIYRLVQGRHSYSGSRPCRSSKSCSMWLTSSLTCDIVVVHHERLRAPAWHGGTTRGLARGWSGVRNSNPESPACLCS